MSTKRDEYQAMLQGELDKAVERDGCRHSEGRFEVIVIDNSKADVKESGLMQLMARLLLRWDGILIARGIAAAGWLLCHGLRKAAKERVEGASKDGEMARIKVENLRIKDGRTLRVVAQDAAKWEQVGLWGDSGVKQITKYQSETLKGGG